MGTTGQLGSDGTAAGDGCHGENAAFLSEQIMTYIGNKRSLLGFIGKGLGMVQKRLGKEKLVVADLFAGSGIVSRYLKQYASVLYSNDLEAYSACANSCYLTNRSEVDRDELQHVLQGLRSEIQRNWKPGFIAELYAPQDDGNIQRGERAFFTRRNAIYIDTARRAIANLPNKLQRFFLAPLLYGASVHNNTSGVFKGFYKNHDGIGQFGGEGKNALARILGNIELMLPVFSSFECGIHITQLESRDAVRSFPELDAAYLDPPYNQHPYGSNYFMLNLIHGNKRPESLSRVSGIPHAWNRSAYNKAPFAKDALFSVIRECPAKFILLSYNSEGFVKYDEFMAFLSSLGSVRPLVRDYNTFRGSRNLRARAQKVKEFLFLLERK